VSCSIPIAGQCTDVIGDIFMVGLLVMLAFVIALHIK
jgi:hypothetical protein